jgi:hypothetical protein
VSGQCTCCCSLLFRSMISAIAGVGLSAALLFQLLTALVSPVAHFWFCSCRTACQLLTSSCVAHFRVLVQFSYGTICESCAAASSRTTNYLHCSLHQLLQSLTALVSTVAHF